MVKQAKVVVDVRGWPELQGRLRKVSLQLRQLHDQARRRTAARRILTERLRRMSTLAKRGADARAMRAAVDALGGKGRHRS